MGEGFPKSYSRRDILQFSGRALIAIGTGCVGFGTYDALQEGKVIHREDAVSKAASEAQIVDLQAKEQITRKEAIHRISLDRLLKDAALVWGGTAVAIGGIAVDDWVLGDQARNAASDVTISDQNTNSQLITS